MSTDLRWQHDSDQEDCDKPPPTGRELCGHGLRTHEVWVDGPEVWVSDADEHKPVAWHAPGVYPWCSCGYDPKDNTLLNAHWAEHGIMWTDDNGTLVSRPFLPEVPC